MITILNFLFTYTLLLIREFIKDLMHHSAKEDLDLPLGIEDSKVN
tara:strand:- start:344 stop:478 length:135 start_codon:yes stop_codon:yes gene_type:complete